LTVPFGVEKEYLRHILLQLFTRTADRAGAARARLAGGHDDRRHSEPTFALGEEIVRPTRSREEQRSGSTWVVLELERELVPEAAGRLELAPPVLHFARATRFSRTASRRRAARSARTGASPARRSCSR
jgi:hypothetical protein